MRLGFGGIRRAIQFISICLISFSSNTYASQVKDILIDKVQQLEQDIGGRIGLAVLNKETGQSWAYRAEERFPLSSTLKPFACAALLSLIRLNGDDLDRLVPLFSEDLVSYSPVMKKHVGGGQVSLRQACEATVSISDNTAGNLVLKEIGGPKGFTDWMQSIGDERTRLDRWETELNEGRSGDQRDTTTPSAMVESLYKLVLGSVLAPEDQAEVVKWMINDQVADALIRSKLPKGWQIADKTGAGGYGSRGIIAVLWPPDQKPLLVAIYLTDNDADFATRNAVIAEIGGLIIETAIQR